MIFLQRVMGVICLFLGVLCLILAIFDGFDVEGVVIGVLCVFIGFFGLSNYAE